MRSLVVDQNGLASTAHAPTTDPSQTEPDVPAPLVFQIFTDFRGMYRWLLVDASGQRIGQSRHAYAAVASAWRDAEGTRAEEYPTALIAPPPPSG